jgi:hypothetical protein
VRRVIFAEQVASFVVGVEYGAGGTAADLDPLCLSRVIADVAALVGARSYVSSLLKSST